MKTIITLLMICLALPLVSAFDNELTQICGGDEQLLVSCIGDAELNSLGFEPITPVEVFGGGGFQKPKKTRISSYILYLLFLLIFMFFIFFLFILIRRKKSKQEM